MTLAPDSEYHSPTASPTPSRSERRGVSRQTIVEAAKEIPTVDLAKRLCPAELRKLGAELVGYCPLHDDRRTPNFYVNPENDLWFCFVCHVGGDVVELARYAWGYGKHEVAMAAADLLHEFGRPIPERPASWHRKQERQKPIRNALEQAKICHTQRRVFRTFRPFIEELSDEHEQGEEIEYLWDAAGEIAALIVAGSSR